MRQYMIIVSVLVAMAPLLSYAEPGQIALELDSGDKTISYETENVQIAKAYFDADFESLVFEIDAGNDAGSITVDLDTGFFAPPVGLEKYYVQADAEETKAEQGAGDVIKLTVTVEPGVESVEIFGMIIQAEAEPEPEPVAEPPAVTPAPEETTTDDTVVKEEMADGGMAEPEAMCGPGTVLSGGECIVNMQKMQSGECTENGGNPVFTCFKDLATGAVAGVALALVAAVILGAVSKASRKN